MRNPHRQAESEALDDDSYGTRDVLSQTRDESIG
jgi:hypothetical protein